MTKPKRYCTDPTKSGCETDISERALNAHMCHSCAIAMNRNRRTRKTYAERKSAVSLQEHNRRHFKQQREKRINDVDINLKARLYRRWAGEIEWLRKTAPQIAGQNARSEARRLRALADSLVPSADYV